MTTSTLEPGSMTMKDFQDAALAIVARYGQKNMRATFDTVLAEVNEYQLSEELIRRRDRIVKYAREFVLTFDITGMEALLKEAANQ